MRNERDYLLTVFGWWGYDVCLRWSRRFRRIACDAQDRRFGRVWPPDDRESPF
jgi:hypothetical protein